MVSALKASKYGGKPFCGLKEDPFDYMHGPVSQSLYESTIYEVVMCKVVNSGGSIKNYE